MRRPVPPVRSRRVFALASFVVAFGAALVPSARAGTEDDPQYTLRFFGVEDGLPQSHVRALAQTPDGYLWVGTEGGLARFDGVRFQVFDTQSDPSLSSNDVKSLAAGPDGTLWIGIADGALRRVGDTFQSITAETRKTGDGDVIAALVDRDGGAWLGGFRGYTHVRGDTFRAIAKSRHGFETSALAVAQTPDGDVWMGGSHGLLRIRAQERTVIRNDGVSLPRTLVSALAVDTAGTLWVGTAGAGLLRRDQDRFVPVDLDPPLPDPRILALLADPDGGLWVGTDLGLFRIEGTRTWAIGQGQRPLGGARALFEDREGTLWVGTRGQGLLRVTEARLRTLVAGAGPSRPVVAHVDRGGVLWIGTRGEGIARFHQGRTRRITAADGLCVDEVRSLADTADGSLWVGGVGGARANLCRLRAGPGEPLVVESFGPDTGLAGDDVSLLYEDRKGRLWARTKQLYRRDGDRFVAVPSPTNIVRLFEDRHGRLWAGAAGSLYRQIEPAPWLAFSAKPPPRPPLTLGFLEDRHGRLWLGTEEGLYVVAGERGNPVGPLPGLEGTPVLALAEDVPRDDLWLCTARGIFRASHPGVSALAEGRTGDPHVIRFGAHDGLGGDQCVQAATGRRSADDPLYFVGPDRVVAVDPARVRVNRTAPAVLIESVVVDGRPLGLSGEAPLVVPPGPRDLRITYTATSLAAAHEVRFKHRLSRAEDSDDGAVWVDAQASRHAHYMDLSPGRYTFQVIARNQDGVWNARGVAVALVLSPFFHETVLFKVLLAAAAVLLLFGAHRWRVRVVESRHAAVLAERTRVAREIHDTVAQGLAAAWVRLQTLKRTAGALPPEVTRRLDELSELTEATTDEARALLNELHGKGSAPEADPDLLSALGGIARRLAAGSPTAVRVSPAEGRPPGPLPPAVHRALLRIGQEAVSNALRHAEARTISIALVPAADAVELRISDDGHGFDAAAAQGAPEGHFGLAGMRERAAALGGTVRVDSRPGEGTTLVARIPL